MSLEIPPASLENVQSTLQDQTKLVYLIVGDASSEAWTIALAAEQELAGVAAIRFTTRDDAQNWINQAGMVAATSNWAGKIITLLNLSQAEDKDFVLTAIDRDSRVA
ncbi:MAG: hypothetical protein NTX59_02870 [Elusimicrobia bacterium]|nr:hypothetical protein [Elusimicrobiota bacterium]